MFRKIALPSSVKRPVTHKKTYFKYTHVVCRQSRRGKHSLTKTHQAVTFHSVTFTNAICENGDTALNERVLLACLHRRQNVVPVGGDWIGIGQEEYDFFCTHETQK